MIQREPIFRALASKLEAIPGIQTFSRRLLHWSDVAAVDQPALFMACANQGVSRSSRNLPAKHQLPAKLYLYAHTGDDPKVSPSEILNPLLDAIEAALEPDPGQECQTLGGLVSHCHIDGDIETDEGVLGSQGMAIVPISILVP